MTLQSLRIIKRSTVSFHYTHEGERVTLSVDRLRNFMTNLGRPSMKQETSRNLAVFFFPSFYRQLHQVCLSLHLISYLRRNIMKSYWVITIWPCNLLTCLDQPKILVAFSCPWNKQWIDVSANFNRFRTVAVYHSLQSRMGPMNKSESLHGKEQGLCPLHRVIFTGCKAWNPDAYVMKV